MSQSGTGQHVLLTGANGFVASHILDILIKVGYRTALKSMKQNVLIPSQRGYTITATVRSQAKADDIIKTHPSWKSHVEFAIVSDFTSKGPFDKIFQGAKKPFDYVIHTASPLRFQVNDIRKEMIEPAEMG